MAASSVDTIFEQLGSMSVLELVELKKKIEDEWGITAAAPVAVAAPGAAPAGEGRRRAGGGGLDQVPARGGRRDRRCQLSARSIRPRKGRRGRPFFLVL